MAAPTVGQQVVVIKDEIAKNKDDKQNDKTPKREERENRGPHQQHGGFRDRGNMDRSNSDRFGDRRRGGGGRGAGPRGVGGGGGRGGIGFGRGNRGFNHSRNDQQDQLQPEEVAMNTSTDEIPTVPLADKKFTGRCRLFVGNLPNDMNEDKFKELFKPHGEHTEVFLNPSKGFGFIRMDTRANAEAAKAGIDGIQLKGRTLRCRFATHGAALRVRHLSPHVTNELLEQAFGIFGELERAVVIVDDRGKSTGEGVVEFARKPGYNSAMKRINEGVYLLGTTPKPVVVEPLEQKDDADGLPEKFMGKTPEFMKDREQGPRFASGGSFEYDIGNKWKDLYQTFRQQEENLKRQFDEAASKLEFEMENAAMEHQANMLRQDLIRRQEELRRLEEQQQMEMQRRLEQRRQMEEARRQDHDGDNRRREMELRRMVDDRRPQEMFAQERGMRDARREERGNAPPMQPPPAPPAALGIERERIQRGGGGANVGGANQGHMGGDLGLMNEGPVSLMANAGAQMRQSRFDQLPNFPGEPGNNGGGAMNLMGVRAGGANIGRMPEHGGNVEPMGDNRGMMGADRRERNRGRGGGNAGNNDDYFDAKRPRRY